MEYNEAITVILQAGFDKMCQPDVMEHQYMQYNAAGEILVAARDGLFDLNNNPITKAWIELMLGEALDKPPVGDSPALVFAHETNARLQGVVQDLIPT